MARKRILGLIILVPSLILLFTGPPSEVGAVECACDVTCYVYEGYWPKDWDKGKGFVTTKEFSVAFAVTVDLPGDKCIHADYDDADAICETYVKETPSISEMGSWPTSYICVETSYCISTSELGPEAPEIPTLRAFRDAVLVRTATGRRLEALYYRYSPAIVRLLDGNASLKAYALARIREVSRLIDEHLHGDGLGEEDYERVRTIIVDSIRMLHNLQARYPQVGSDSALSADGVADFLTDDTLFEISDLIDRLIDELGHGARFSPAER